MAAFTTIVAIAGLAAAGAGMYQKHEATQDAKKDARNQQSRLRRERDDAKVQQDAAIAARASRARQMTLASGSGYKSTIRTSPLGLSSNAPGRTEFGV